jgi:hypothetical protein
MFLRKIIVAFLFIGLSFNGFSQVKQKPKWILSTDKKEIKVGDEVELVFESPIEKIGICMPTILMQALVLLWHFLISKSTLPIKS